MNWTEEDLSKPQVLVESAWGMGHPGTFHFEPLITDVSHGIYKLITRRLPLGEALRTLMHGDGIKNVVQLNLHAA